MERRTFIRTTTAEWDTSSRWAGIDRPYTAEDVWKLRGSYHIEYTLARMGAERLWSLLHSEPYVHALAPSPATRPSSTCARGSRPST